MGFGLRLAAVALAMTLASLVNSIAWAGDDGQAPLWQGIGSIFSPILGFGFGDDKPPPIDYHEHGKIVVPPNMVLPPPGAAASADADWPVNQEVLKKKAQKEAERKKTIAGAGDARLRYTHPFPPNEPVTVRTTDPQGNEVKCEGACGSTSSALGNLNPLNWVGMGSKNSQPLGPEPDREWLTDPPKGFRAPVEPSQQGPAPQGSASN